jgi:glutamyl-Q tRNA(Asp) synthetase
MTTLQQSLTSVPKQPYIGRFAPSPSGELHFGSLITALGSYLQAKKNNGQWLLRIEDIDPPREVAGASQGIIESLERHQLLWDNKIVYQSQRSHVYEGRLAELLQQNLTYNCHCTRAELAMLDCKNCCPCANQGKSPEGAAIRFKKIQAITTFYDGLQQRVVADDNAVEAHFCLKRKDGLYAYQLAVVSDDIEQGITEVVRGADLLQATFYQLALYRAFAVPAPRFVHLPLVINAEGKKLSKQNHAQVLDPDRAKHNLVDAMKFLGLSPPSSLIKANVETMLSWAIESWDLAHVPKVIACHDNRIAEL